MAWYLRIQFLLLSDHLRNSIRTQLSALHKTDLFLNIKVTCVLDLSHLKESDNEVDVYYYKMCQHNSRKYVSSLVATYYNWHLTLDAVINNLLTCALVNCHILLQQSVDQLESERGKCLESVYFLILNRWRLSCNRVYPNAYPKASTLAYFFQIPFQQSSVMMGSIWLHFYFKF